MMGDFPEVSIKAIVGRKNSSPARPFVACEIDTWLSPARARRVAARLVKAAERADALYAAKRGGAK